MRHLARSLCLFLLLVVTSLVAPPVYAQENVEPFLTIAEADTAQFPTVQVAVYGDTLTGNIADLPVQLRENGEVQTILTDTTETVGVQLAIALDSYELAAAGSSGQTHQAEAIGILLDLIEQEVVVRNQDWLAAFTVAAGGDVQTIQDWTGEPNLIFNSTVQSNVAAIDNDEQLTSLALGVLDKFQAQAPADYARAALLLTAGNSQLDLENVVARANTENVHFHVIELTSPDSQATNGGALQDLAARTNGAFIRLQGPGDLPPLWRRLGALRNQRLLTYNSAAADPASREVELTLPNGTPLVAGTGLGGGAAELPQASASANEAAPTPEEAADTTALAAAPAPGDSNTQPAPDTAAETAAETAPATSPETAANAAAEAAAEPTAAPTSVAPAAVAQSAQEIPADEAAVPTAGAGVPGNETAAETVGDVVYVPGTALALPRPLLELALPILLILLLFFGWRELRDRRKRRLQPAGAVDDKAPAAGRQYELHDELDDLQPLAPRKLPAYSVNTAQQDELPALEPAPVRSAAPAPAEVDDYDDATVVPLRFEDDEATYRLREAIDLPLLGTLVRVTNDPNLPQQLPVYGLNPGPGEARQIHIGRHSKNNTVVINDKSISREHAVIIQKEGRLYLRDNASTAGTFLNWRRLKPGEELLLRHNDLISFGEIVYEFRNKGEDEATIANG